MSSFEIKRLPLATYILHVFLKRWLYAASIHLISKIINEIKKNNLF